MKNLTKTILISSIVGVISSIIYFNTNKDWKDSLPGEVKPIYELATSLKKAITPQQYNRLASNIDEPIDRGGNTLLMRAIDEGHFPLAKYLIEKGASFNARNNQGEDCIDLIAKHEHDFRDSSILRFLNGQMAPNIHFKGTADQSNRALFLFRNHYLRHHPDKIQASDKPLIPKKIHQVWVGPKPVPKRVRWMMATWQELNPDWEYKLWTDADLETFGLENQKAYDQAPNYGAKSDIFRVEILERLGGVYVDVDFECLKPLDELHHKYDFYCGLLGYQEEIANGLIASRPHHPVLRTCIDRWKSMDCFDIEDLDEIIATTGPKFLTNVVAQYLVQEENFDAPTVVFPVRYFFAFPSSRRFDFWNGSMSRDEVMSYKLRDSYGFHYWATSWQ